MLGAVSEGREIEKQRIVLVDEPALFGGEGDSLVFLSPSTFFFYLFVIFPLPAVVANVGVDHLSRNFFLRIHRTCPGKTLAFYITIYLF